MSSTIIDWTKIFHCVHIESSDEASAYQPMLLLLAKIPCPSLVPNTSISVIILSGKLFKTKLFGAYFNLENDGRQFNKSFQSWQTREMHYAYGNNPPTSQWELLILFGEFIPLWNNGSYLVISLFWFISTCYFQWRDDIIYCGCITEWISCLRMIITSFGKCYAINIYKSANGSIENNMRICRVMLMVGYHHTVVKVIPVAFEISKSTFTNCQ